MNRRIKYNPTLPFIHNNYPGNLLIDSKFVNNYNGRVINEHFQYSKLFRWLFRKNPKKAEKRLDNFRIAVNQLHAGLTSDGNQSICTFDLSDKPLVEPIRKLKKLKEKGHLSGHLMVPGIGNPINF